MCLCNAYGSYTLYQNTLYQHAGKARRPFCAAPLWNLTGRNQEIGMRVVTAGASVALAILMTACDGRPLLYQLAPSDSDLAVLAVFQRIDSAHAGQLTRQQADDYFRARFVELDRNRDGFLDEQEAAGAVPVFGFKTGSAMVFSLDINGDGRLSLDEFLRLSNYLFTRDLNRDGILTLAEVKTPPTDSFVASSTPGKPGVQVTDPGKGGLPQ